MTFIYQKVLSKSLIGELPLRIATETVDEGMVNESFSFNFQGQGGDGNYTWDRTTINNVPGLSLTTSGVLSGTPSQAGDFTLDVRLRDTANNEDRKSFQITIYSELMIITESIVSSYVGENYSFFFEAIGGNGEYSWSISNGSLPNGLDINDNGELFGIIQSSGIFTFTVRVDDSRGAFDEKEFTIEIYDELVITTEEMPNGTAGEIYTLRFEATGGTEEYNWSLVNPSIEFQNLGLSFSSTGVLNGTLNLLGVGEYSLIVRVEDSFEAFDEKEFVFTVNSGLEITTDIIPNALTDQPYSFQFTAENGQVPYEWSMIDSIPIGMSFSESGELTANNNGINLRNGDYTLNVRVIDSIGGFDEKEFDFLIETIIFDINGPTQLIEGQGPYNYTISSSNFSGDMIVYWRVVVSSNVGETFADADFEEAGGSINVVSGTGNFSISPIVDAVSEDTRLFDIVLSNERFREYGRLSIGVNDEVGDFVLDGPRDLIEGQSYTYTVSSQNVPNGTLVSWKIVEINNAEEILADLDFETTQGQIEIQNNSGSFDITVLNDAISESIESFDIAIIDNQQNDYDRITVNVNSVSYSISGPRSLIEGQSYTYTVSSQNVPDNSIIYWRVVENQNINEIFADRDFDQASGSITIQNNSGSFTITVLTDSIVEPVENFDIVLSNELLLDYDRITVSIEQDDILYNITGPSSINEGQFGEFTVSTDNFGSGTLYWSINGTVNDFSSISGQITMTNNIGTLRISPLSDLTTEGNETYTVSIKNSPTGDTLVSRNFVVNDTSQTPVNATISSNVTSVSENRSVIFTLNPGNAVSGTVFRFGIKSSNGFSRNDIGDIFVENGNTIFGSGITDLSNIGEFVVGVSEQISVGIRTDNIYESESFQLFLVDYPTIESNVISIIDISNISISSDKTVVQEGGQVIFTLNTTNISSNTVFRFGIRSTNGFSKNDIGILFIENGNTILGSNITNLSNIGQFVVGVSERVAVGILTDSLVENESFVLFLVDYPSIVSSVITVQG